MSFNADDEEWMNVIENSPNSNGAIPSKPNYESILQSIGQFEKQLDKVDFEKSLSQSQDLTADLFSTMSDMEMLSHFLPVQGIDYDQNYNNEDDDLLKKDNKKEEISTVEYFADQFLPHRMMPQLNPLYKLTSAFKAVKPTTGSEEPEKNTQIAEANVLLRALCKEAKSKKSDEPEGPLDEVPREIKKRKPRTYKYNPKPVRQKECRSFVPDDLKDIEYWERRKRNNEAAKKSRNERRKKELEILGRCDIMKQEHSQMRVENIRLKARNAVLEKQVVDLKKKIETRK